MSSGEKSRGGDARKSSVFLLALVLLVVCALVSCSQKERITPYFASTYLSGSGYDKTDCIVLDEEGYIYGGGDTNSLYFPTTSGVFRTENKGSFDVFVAKLSNDLKTLLALTLVGGSGRDRWNQIILDKKGNTPAHLAPMYNHRYVLEALLSRGIDLAERNDDGDTALHVASKFGVRIQPVFSCLLELKKTSRTMLGIRLSIWPSITTTHTLSSCW